MPLDQYQQDLVIQQIRKLQDLVRNALPLRYGEQTQVDAMLAFARPLIHKEKETVVEYAKLYDYFFDQQTRHSIPKEAVLRTAEVLAEEIVVGRETKQLASFQETEHTRLNFVWKRLQRLKRAAQYTMRHDNGSVLPLEHALLRPMVLDGLFQREHLLPFLRERGIRSISQQSSSGQVMIEHDDMSLWVKHDVLDEHKSIIFSFLPREYDLDYCLSGMYLGRTSSTYINKAMEQYWNKDAPISLLRLMPIFAKIMEDLFLQAQGQGQPVALDPRSTNHTFGIILDDIVRQIEQNKVEWFGATGYYNREQVIHQHCEYLKQQVQECPFDPLLFLKALVTAYYHRAVYTTSSTMFGDLLKIYDGFFSQLK